MLLVMSDRLVRNTYKLSYMPNVLVRALQQAFFESWYHLKDLSKSSVLPPFSDG